MKLATALLERANLQVKLNEIKTRLNNNAKVQDGEEPTENPNALLEELDEALNRLEYLMARINITNNSTMVDGVRLTELLAKKDCLKQRLCIMREFLNNASQKIQRYSKTEIKIISTVPVAELQKEVDKIAKELRVTDEKIQEVNWLTELV